MKKLVAKVLGIASGALMLSACLTAPVMPPWGMIYNDYKAPLDYDQQASSAGMKSGESSTMSILGLVALGDGSIKTAASNGGVTKIHGADYKYFNVLGVYQKYTTIVEGE